MGHQRMRVLASGIDRALSDRLMGFLALLSLFLGSAPAVFDPDLALVRTVQ